MTTTTCAERLARARDELTDRGVDALLIGPSADLRYLTGYHPPALERLTLLVVPAKGDARMVVPALEAPLAHEHLGDLDVELALWRETDDPVALVRGALEASGSLSGPLAVGDQLWSTFLLRLQAALPSAEFTVASAVTRQLRMVKDAAEVAALARAAAVADQVVDDLAEVRWAGRSERDVARELDARVRAVHDETLFVIVGAGPNSASPHHEPGERVIEPGDAVVIDIGGRLDGYCSDTTRTLVVGEPPDGFLELYEVLRSAQRAGCAAVRAGVPAEAVDAACREAIAAGGYGEHFIHRTGHGIGLEAHEDPYIVAGNTDPLAPGMAFSVEPGIYLAGRYGARIEDVVVCPEPDGVAAQGARRLNQTSRDLRVVRA
ncbi:MAG TPA: Xaa-Pro peptidase family protein [Actinomycetes bacterium]|jgi:Xaa-Pro aminopeptidase|nr:Xaa-Pro peptidase family protein [Actinomycetes bacterium]